MKQTCSLKSVINLNHVFMKEVKFFVTIAVLLIYSAIQAQTQYVGPRANTADDPVNAIYVAPNGDDATTNGSIGKPYKCYVINQHRNTMIIVWGSSGWSKKLIVQ
jgi:hypothetical protein